MLKLSFGLMLCAFSLACGTTLTPAAGAKLSVQEAIAVTKAYWDREATVAERRPPDREIAWRLYEKCVQTRPESSVEECGSYSTESGARSGMESLAEELTRRGQWIADWEPTTKSWFVRAQIQAFPWTFRIYETTLTVEVLRHQ